VAACSLERGTISFFRKVSASPPAFAATPVFQLKHRSIFHPDGLGFSRCGGWLAVANHGKQTVAIFRRDDKRSGAGALAFHRRPAAVIADPRFRYPHSVAFTPDTNHLLVTNAGANYLCAYAPVRGWFGRMGWSQTAVAQIMVHDDDAFREVNTADKMEGGPKGIAIYRNTVAVCSPQIGVKLYSFREGWR
jgi:DNA-binding beta-propeller fold protein YncE